MPDMMYVDQSGNPQFTQWQPPAAAQEAIHKPGPFGKLMEYGGGQHMMGLMPGRRAFAYRMGTHIRGSNTILGGGYGEAGEVNQLKNVFDWQKYNPRRAMRYRSPEEMFKRQGSHIAKFAEERAAKGGTLGNIASKVGGVDESGISRFHEGIFGGQMWSRLQAAGRLERGGALSAQTAGSVGETIAQANPQLAEAMRVKATIPNPMHTGGATTEIGMGAPVFESGDEAAMALRMSGRSAIGQTIGGYASVGKEMTGKLEEYGAESAGRFMAARASGEISTAAVKQLGTGIFKKAAVEGGTEVALKTGEKVAVETGLKAGTKMLAERGAVMAAGLAEGPVGWAIDVGLLAWTAFDIAKIGGQLVKQAIINPAMKAVKEGYRSYVGQAYKSPFGMGYVDNEVAATSRARGVQAIQNSRLNARSLLGSEGSMMYAHFG